MEVIDKEALANKILKHPLLHGAEGYAALRIIQDEPAVNVWRHGKPDEAGEYIVTIHGAAAATTLYYSAEQDEWQDDNQEVYRVDAWMPLPNAWSEHGNRRRYDENDGRTNRT